MKKLMMICLVSSSCVSFKPTYIYTPEFGICKRQLYDINKLEVIGKVDNLPIEFCNTVIGIKIEDWLKEVKPTIILNKRRCDDK